MQHILLTGVPGVGKTTIIRSIIKKLTDIGIELDGFYTQEFRNDRNQRLGFEIVLIKNNVHDLLADKSNVPSNESIRKLGQYTVYLRKFENLVLPVLLNFDKKLLIIDEIGKMELFSKRFEEIVGKAFDSQKYLILATVPIKGTPFVEKLKRNAGNRIYTVSQQNRDDIANEILSCVKAELKI